MALPRCAGRASRQPADALPYLESAIARDPSFGIAYGFLALAKIMIAGYGQAPDAALEEALAMASKAMTLSPDQEIGPRVRSLARLYLRQFHGAEADIRLALDLNRYSADAIEQMGYLLILRGKPLSALAWIDRAGRLDPLHPAFYHYDRGLAFYGLGEYEKAAEAFERPTFLPPWVAVRLAACYAQLGDPAGARRNIAAGHGDRPELSGPLACPREDALRARGRRRASCRGHRARHQPRRNSRAVLAARIVEPRSRLIGCAAQNIDGLKGQFVPCRGLAPSSASQTKSGRYRARSMMSGEPPLRVSHRE